MNRKTWHLGNNSVREQKQHSAQIRGAAGVTVNRRAFLWAGGASAIGSFFAWNAAIPARAASAASPAPTAPQPPLPVVDARFPCRVAEGVWLLPDKRTFLVPNVGIVEGSRAVLVVDCGLSPDSGRDVLAAARAIAGPKRELILTVTHAHPEHTFGAQAFKGEAKIYYNKLQRDYLARAGAKLLEGFRTGVLPPERAYLVDKVQITLADEVYEGERASLDLGGRAVEFRTWGVAHSPGDQVITVPDQGVVFAGDLIEERMFPIVPFFPPLIGADDIRLRTWEAALTEIVAGKPRLVVPGHGNLGGPEIAQAVVDYFVDLRRLVAAEPNPPNKAEAAAAREALGQLEDRARSQRPTWEHPEFIAPALRYLTEQAEA